MNAYRVAKAVRGYAYPLIACCIMLGGSAYLSAAAQVRLGQDEIAGYMAAENPTIPQYFAWTEEETRYSVNLMRRPASGDAFLNCNYIVCTPSIKQSSPYYKIVSQEEVDRQRAKNRPRWNYWRTGGAVLLAAEMGMLFRTGSLPRWAQWLVHVGMLCTALVNVRDWVRYWRRDKEFCKYIYPLANKEVPPYIFDNGKPWHWDVMRQLYHGVEKDYSFICSIDFPT